MEALVEADACWSLEGVCKIERLVASQSLGVTAFFFFVWNHSSAPGLSFSGCPRSRSAERVSPGPGDPAQPRPVSEELGRERGRPSRTALGFL